MSEECLDQSHHSAYLALLPQSLKRGKEACEKVGHVLRNFQLAIFAVDLPGIDSTFKADAVSKFQQLTSYAIGLCSHTVISDPEFSIARSTEALGSHVRNPERVRGRETAAWRGYCQAALATAYPIIVTSPSLPERSTDFAFANCYVADGSSLCAG